MRKANRGGRTRDHRSDRVGESSSSWKDLNQDQSLRPKLVPASPPLTSQPQNLEPTSTIGEPISNSVPRISRNSRNPKWISRNRPGRGVKPRFVKKSEVGSLEGEVGLLSIDGRVDGQVENVEKDERGGRNCSGSVSGSKNEVVVESSKEESNDVIDVLEELRPRLSVEEPQLSEEQYRSNCQSQEDELLALESIYGGDVIIFNRDRGLKSFQVHVHIEAPNGIPVTTKLNSSGVLKTTGNNIDDFSYSFKVQYIPPIVFTCLLPKSYPSHLPPYFTIAVQWLDSVKIANLCSMLDYIWKEQKGQEVMYKWVEWLKSSTLSFLGFDKEIMLGPYGIKHTEDRRAVSGSVSPDIDVPFLRSYNDERLHENFKQNIHECCICFSEYAGTEFMRLPCHHFFCRKCMKTYSDIHVNEGTVSMLRCPDAKCRGMVPPSLLKQLLSAEEYERWESLTLQKTLESMSDIAYCPRCETPCIEDEDHHAQCSQCFFSFCTICRERRHVGAECLTPELKLQILQERQNSSRLKDEQKRRERELINELLSVKEILRNAKLCPSCKMAISRTEGCNKMVCNNCGQYFCYRCNKAIDGYDHFRAGTCDLFPQEVIQNWEENIIPWEERINPRQVIGQMQVHFFGGNGHGQLCPNCRQFNVKVGNNNHLFCWACQVNYCYLCKKIVRRGSQHYGPKGCKQHTEG
ncbi:E3 ubiquitin ligase RBR family [Parasponia andersonii]|uniref:RBR-type E3 ubiquitin transferase n=1 Tax=Parasponia andersonii TaxID=3476 RepID=A0A2P5BHP4_PARAD|nr:E3 ubiquitin ligase RBR family [Parasponia andersonii]